MKMLIGFIGIFIIVGITQQCNKIPFEELDTVTPQEVLKPLVSTTKQENLICGYTRYQVLMWSLKANESYSHVWYPDGDYKAIGFGYNHLGQKKRKEQISWATKDGKVTYTEATQILCDYVERIGKSDRFVSFSKKKKLDDWQEIAVIAHMYNCGSVQKTGIQGCCGKRTGCGKGYNSHNQRRKFEVALWNHDEKYVKQELIKYQIKAAQLERTAKSQNLYK